MNANLRYMVQMGRAFKYRLYPTKPQLVDLDRTLMRCRHLYNAALQERRDVYRKAGKTVGPTNKAATCQRYGLSCRSTRAFTRRCSRT